jgi:hypothetical protein
MEEMRNVYNILVGKLEGKRPLGRPTRMWEDGDIIRHREVRWEDVDCIHLAQDMEKCQDLVNMVMNLQASQKAANLTI